MEQSITGGILQDGGEAMIQILIDLFNTCMHHRQGMEECADCLDT